MMLTPGQEEAYQTVYLGEYPMLTKLDFLRSELERLNEEVKILRKEVSEQTLIINRINEEVALWKADSETGKALLADMTERAEKAQRARDKVVREYYNIIDKFSLCDECVNNKDKCIDAYCVDLIKAWAESE